jgi:protein SCO1/2
MMVSSWMRAGLLAALFALLAGCQPKHKFENTDVSGATYGKDFALTDHTGKPRTLADFKGKVVAMFFGYTQCPDVCPTTMVMMREVMQQLGDDANRTQVLFVTIDPERDTQALLKQYVPSFDPRFLGLTGTPEQIAATAKEFKVFYQKVPSDNAGNYTMDHFAGMYLYDPEGHLRLFVRYGQQPGPIANDIRALLNKQ